MPILLVRHAVAVGRSKWPEDDVARPLTKRGERQANELVRQLSEQPLHRVLSSPYVRCVGTVVPLARARGVVVEPTDALAEGGAHAAVELVRSLIGVPVVLCSHGDVIPHVLEHFARVDRLDLGDDPHCAKGSTWILEDDGQRFAKAFYLPPAG
jgi:broad specificity phosphatase PhoE